MSRSLHIGLLTPALSGLTGDDSGIGAHFRHLADGLAQAGHRVTVIVSSDKFSTVTERPAPGVHMIASRSRLARIAGRFSWQLHRWFTVRAGMHAAAEAAARVPNVDIWETTSSGSLALPFLAIRARPPVAVRVSTTAVQLRTTNVGALHWIDRRIERWEAKTVRRADRVLTHSASHRAAIAGEFALSPERIPIIPHGIPIPPIPRRSAQSAGCHILYVGRLEHRKGIDILVAALPEILRGAPQADVTIVGADRDHYWSKYWQHNGPPELRSRVKFAGAIAPEALAARYHDADVFVAPSRYESFGLIFAEAMAHALPVVALHAPGATDLIENNVTGRLVPPEKPAQLAAAILELAHDVGLRHRLGAAGRQVAETRYSLPALATASAAFYREMLQAKANRNAT